MIVYIDGKEVETKFGRIEISIGETSFKLNIDKFDNLVINKQVYDDSDGAILIRPSVSNEIRLK